MTLLIKLKVYLYQKKYNKRIIDLQKLIIEKCKFFNDNFLRTFSWVIFIVEVES